MVVLWKFIFNTWVPHVFNFKDIISINLQTPPSRLAQWVTMPRNISSLDELQKKTDVFNFDAVDEIESEDWEDDHRGRRDSFFAAVSIFLPRQSPPSSTLSRPPIQSPQPAISYPVARRRPPPFLFDFLLASITAQIYIYTLNLKIKNVWDLRIKY